MNYSDALPNQEGYYWRKDKSGFESVRRVFMNPMDELVTWTTTVHGKDAAVSIEKFRNSKWAGPISRPGDRLPPPGPARTCPHCCTVYLAGRLDCPECGGLNPSAPLPCAAPGSPLKRYVVRGCVSTFQPPVESKPIFSAYAGSLAEFVQRFVVDNDVRGYTLYGPLLIEEVTP